MKNHQNGFTLIEILVVISIIGILSATLIPFILAAQKRAYDTGASACAKSIQTVQGVVFIDSNKYTKIGSQANEINKSTDGLNGACKKPFLYTRDRSDESKLYSEYTIDIWDARGTKVFTVTANSFSVNASGSTAFSIDGSGGVNIP
ncbi:type II secretion system protein [Deinococcus sp. 23YEL01]|uniref:type II secretion system protein n=1 Tax=Deinococcus sp. 23YEL01 TaxID=2745871 RepID=UPI001E48035B|nr:type II secretion system protein [Deinococcus sp. 23YEL01]MCD0169398.1 type II secretion system protein [Deinococcus sp. 23YEL01]